MNRTILCIIIVSIKLGAITNKDIHSYFWANYKQFQGESKEAKLWYDKIISDSNSPHAYKGYIYYLFENNKINEIYPLINKIDSHYKNDIEIQLIFVTVLEALGYKNRAEEKLFNLHAQYPKNSEIAFRTAQAYMSKKEMDNAISVLDTYLNSAPRRPNNFIFHFLKAQIYIKINKPQEALTAAKESIEVYPNFDKGWLLIGSLQEQVGQLEEAIDGYQNFLSLTPTKNDVIEQHLFGLILRQKLAEQKNSTTLLQKSCFDKALSLFKRQLYDETIEQLDKCLKQNSHDKDSRLLKIETLTAKKDYKTACNTLSNWIIENPNELVWIKTLHLVGINKQAKEITLATAQQLCNKHPNNEWLPLYTSDLYLRNNNHNQAYRLLQKSANICTNKKRRATIYYQQALVSFEQENYENALTALENGHRDEPSFAPLLNLLSFYWTTKGKNPQRGLYYIKKALSQEPNNHHYRDTYAFILYKQGDYAQAEEILNHLVSLCKKNANMMLHLAKVRHKTGNEKGFDSLLKKAEKYARNKYEQHRVEKFVKKINS